MERKEDKPEGKDADDGDSKIEDKPAIDQEARAAAERMRQLEEAQLGLFTVHLTRSNGGHFGIWLVQKDGRIVVATSIGQACPRRE